MLELARDLLPLLRSGVAVAAVTVTHVARSAPRGVGATMAVTGEGRVLGSISGGCVESDAIALAHLAIGTGVAQHGRFGFSDETAHAAGLACGGTVEVLAYPVRGDAVTITALEAAAAARPLPVAVVATGPEAGRTVSADDARARLTDAAAWPFDEAVRHHESKMLHSAYIAETPPAEATDVADLLLLGAPGAPRLIILGAGEHAAALCRVGAAAGFSVTVCDPWHTLVTADRFPDAETLETAIPADHLASLDHALLDARTAVCVLTHDERLDVPALAAALRLPVGFVGAMGARSTVAHRLELLRQAGVAEVDLARIHSPLGLDLGGSSPDETAVSVLAEIIASRHGGSGRPLGELAGPIHSSRADACTASPTTTGTA
ncbi:xanthine dehydrogenase accessory factor [Microbacterium terrae]|uniref:Xanthine dehydrogenase subunit A n=1 Tax=Microbacterium terrae TaxID=69369 RepID=A0A0M2HHH5_9MICO|nr:XdhC/CoxI family protein [Microbacterium terrae]KJL44228.1 putative xanthine dehydrogenase subunit A [Microbacterium terrae]MBP1078768.1 xanthine dehydrogenase accessory factor [Microbacterium terrae]GLJ98169.1 hypothetical protein GCM10017594_13660 [Microbacterium terrae]